MLCQCHIDSQYIEKWPQFWSFWDRRNSPDRTVCHPFLAGLYRKELLKAHLRIKGFFTKNIRAMVSIFCLAIFKQIIDVIEHVEPLCSPEHSSFCYCCSVRGWMRTTDLTEWPAR